MAVIPHPATATLRPAPRRPLGRGNPRQQPGSSSGIRQITSGWLAGDSQLALRRPVLYGWLAIAGIAVTFLITVDLHLRLSDQVSPIWQTVSEYVHGSVTQTVDGAPGLFTAMCLALALGSLALMAGIATYRRPGRAQALVCLGIWCTGLVMVALFPVDPPGATSTIHGDVHNYSALLAFLALPSAAWALTKTRILHAHGSCGAG